MKVKKIKKLMKNSNGFLSIHVKGYDGIICLNEYDIIRYYIQGISVVGIGGPRYYIPWASIAKVTAHKTLDKSENVNFYFEY